MESVKGFINVNKPSGVTSAFVVSKLKKKFNIKTIGHMGTLDPLASGVLPIAVGRATRLFDYFLKKNKTYEAVFEFGYETNTLDSDGEITLTSKKIPTKQDILNILPKFIGKISQVPPNFSAKKINGNKSYDLARNNVEFILKPVEIEVTEFTLKEQINSTSFSFIITCSSGTYIRSLGRDLAYALNTYATMTKLVRVNSGVFNINNSFSLDEILNSANSINEFLTPIENVFNYKIINLNQNEFEKLKNGLGIKYPFFDGYAFLKFNDILLGVGHHINDKLKIKTFLL